MGSGQVMACCLTTPNRNLNQHWLIINKACWHLAEDNFTETVPDITHYKVLEHIFIFENIVTSLTVQWVHQYIPRTEGRLYEACHDVNFVVIVGIGGCHDDNLRCHQWRRQSWHHNDSQFPVIVTSCDKHQNESKQIMPLVLITSKSRSITITPDLNKWYLYCLTRVYLTLIF